MDVLVDTNIILLRLHRAHPQHRQTRGAIAKLLRDGHRLCVTSQNLMELWAVCTRPVDRNGLGLSPVQADRVLGRVENAVIRLPDIDDVYAEWRHLVVAHAVSGKKIHDTRLAAAMRVHQVTHILTFNAEDFARYPDIVVLDPRSFA